MDTTSSLACDIQPRQRLSIAHTLAFNSSFEATHAVVNDRCDDGDIKWFCSKFGSINDVVVELFATSCLARWLIPGLTRGVCWERSTFRILCCLLRGLKVLL